jgi:hypothetical protein
LWSELSAVRRRSLFRGQAYNERQTNLQQLCIRDDSQANEETMDNDRLLETWHVWVSTFTARP